MADLSKPRVVAVGGPTASGKTALSVALARAFDGEIINADSMQIYKNLDVGTAKPSAEEPGRGYRIIFWTFCRRRPPTAWRTSPPLLTR